MAAVEPEPTKRTTCSSVAPDRVPDDPPRLGPEARRLEARARRLGVRVGVERQDRVAQVVLDERQAAAGGGVVGVGDAADAERARHRLVVADDRGADQLDEAGRVRSPGVRRGAVRAGRRGFRAGRWRLVVHPPMVAGLEWQNPAMTPVPAAASPPPGLLLFLGYAFLVLGAIGVSLRWVVDQAISAPVSVPGIVVMVLLAYTIFTHHDGAPAQAGGPGPGGRALDADDPGRSAPPARSRAAGRDRAGRPCGSPACRPAPTVRPKAWLSEP